MPDLHATDSTPNDRLREALKSQLHAALAMLREAIEVCPEALWDDRAPANAFWQVIHHTLFMTHMNLIEDEADFEPWEHQRPAQYPDGLPGPADPDSTLPLITTPDSREEALAYWQYCDDLVDAGIDAIDLTRADSGSPRYPDMPKLEYLLNSLRHLQHHTGQVADRVRAAADVGVHWVKAGREA